MSFLSKLMLLALSMALAVAFLAPSTSATPTTENCDGDVSVTGAGSTLQEDAQTPWKAVFNSTLIEGDPYCDNHFPGFASIGYDSIDSADGRARFESRAPADGTNPAAWWSTDEAPNASQLHEIEEEGPNSPTDNGETVTIPVAGQAIAIILNVPDACIGTMTNLDEHGRVEITNTDIEAAYHGTITTWAALVDTNNMACAETPIDPIARADSSGTTAQFKGWLYTQFNGAVVAASTWQDLQASGSNTTWPGAVEKPASGGSGLAAAVASTDGAIGYVGVSDARDGGFWMSSTSDDKYWTEVQTPESTWTDPATNEESASDGGANCDNADYAGVPAAGHSEADWATVTGYNTDVDTVYPICALTYAVAWANAKGAAGHTLAQACTVRHYIGYSLQNGQASLGGIDYSPLPGAVLTVAEANQEEVAEGLACPTASPNLEVTDETSSEHCPEVTVSGTDVNGGCLTHTASESGVVLKKHAFGIEFAITTCNTEFASRIDEGGKGYIFEQALTGAGCSRQACKDGAGEQEPWLFHSAEGSPSGLPGVAEYLTTELCLEPIGGGNNETCKFNIPLHSYENQHRQEYGYFAELPGLTGGTLRCELEGHWNSETGGTHDGDAEQEVVITHLNEPPPPHQELEFNEESSGAHCPAVAFAGTDVNGGCLTHFTSMGGGVVLKKHVAGVESTITTCNHEFAARIDENGTGYIFEHVLSGAGCQRQACKNPAGEQQPWYFEGNEGVLGEVLEGFEFLTTELCLEPVGGGVNESCEIDVPFQSYESDHRQEYGHATELPAHGITGFKCEFSSAHWSSEKFGSHDGGAEQEVVVRH